MFYFKRRGRNGFYFSFGQPTPKTSRSKFSQTVCCHVFRITKSLDLIFTTLSILFLQKSPFNMKFCSFLLMPLDVAATTTRSKFFSTTSNSPPLYYNAEQRCSTREFLININVNQLNGAHININFYQLNSSRELSISTQLELL